MPPIPSVHSVGEPGDKPNKKKSQMHVKLYFQFSGNQVGPAGMNEGQKA